MVVKRRNFIKSALAVSAAVILPSSISFAKRTLKATQRVIVIGGGFSGATAAKYLKIWGANLEVIMIERNAQFVSCPQSNLVIGGNRTLQQLTHDYQGLTDYGVQTVQAEVVAIDTDKQQVRLHGGVTINYDRLIIAPGIDFVYDDLPMLDNYEAQQKIPHAWKAGPQTTILKQQLHSMKQGGTMVMTVPATPFRCPPGPYERACQVAYYLKNHNPTAKLLILDANGDVASKKALFKSVWQEYYADLIEYIPNSSIESVDVKTLDVETEFDSFSANVLNVIPQQKAGKVAEMAGIIDVDHRWCSVDFLTYESKVKNKVHVIGDAVHAKLPKSGHMANAQAKVCAAAVIALLSDQQPEQEPVFSNTCYSFVDNKRAGHVAAVYRYDKEKLAMIAMPGGGVSVEATELEGAYAEAWAKNIWADTLR